MAALFFHGVQIADRGAANLTWGRRLLRNKAGVGYGFEVEVTAGSLGLACAGAADAAVKAAMVAEILSIPNGDLVFDGVRFATDAATLDGIRCVEGPVWSNRPGANGETYLEYAATWSWSYFTASAPRLQFFTETVTVTGGTQQPVERGILNGPNIIQAIITAQCWRAVQAGQQVGISARYADPGPIWPALIVDQSITNRSAERMGNAYVNYFTGWQYQFLSPPALPLIPLPNEWL
jgi:hypothetical protein